MKTQKFQGESIYLDVPAGKKAGNVSGGAAGGQLLGPGLWALHSRSTVPFVRVNIGAIGSRTLTWGEILEVPEGHFGDVMNASFHAGDIIMADTGCCVAPPRPARVTVPASITHIGGGDVAEFEITRWVDTRLVRRAYLAVHPLEAVQGGFTYTVEQMAPTQGSPLNPSGPAATNGGIVVMNRAVIGPLEMLPLGFGSSEYLDPAGNTVPEYRPMSLLDQARVKIAAAMADALGFTKLTDAFFVLEY